MTRAAIRLVALCALFLLPARLKPGSDAPIRMEEAFQARSTFEISTSINLSGRLPANLEQFGKEAGTSAISALGATRYVERVLETPDPQTVRATVRLYRSATLDKKIAETPQHIDLRSSVARIVIRRSDGEITAFSPDGALTGPELDLIRAETFTPALSGILPRGPVQPGDHWDVTAEAASELTGIAPIQSGGLRCSFREIQKSDQGKVARVAIGGSLSGPSDHGQSRQTIDGYYLFSLEHQHVTRLVLDGRSEILGDAEPPVGEVRARYELERHPSTEDARLSDKALAAVPLEASAQTTALVFDGPKLGARFLYPRNWELRSAKETRIEFREPTGGDMRLVIDPSPLPSPEKLQKDLVQWLEHKQEAKITATLAPQPLRLEGGRTAQQFMVRAEFPESKNRKPADWYYVLLRQGDRAALLSASLLTHRAELLHKDVDFIASKLEFLAK